MYISYVSVLYIVVLDMCIYIYVMDVVFFFFKQKTAYEMRISDLSSDVCSSDLSKPGGVELDGVPIDLRTVKTPTFLLASREDHIAPWKGEIGRASCRERVCQYV